MEMFLRVLFLVVLIYSIFETKSQGAKRVIVNADPGIDDYLALLQLLYSDSIGLVKIEAIWCSYGNTNLTNSCGNTIRLLELTERTDIPVFQGVQSSLLVGKKLSPYWGEDGLGDLQYDSDPNMLLLQNELSSKAIRDIVVNNYGEISLVALAPLTDIAITLKLYEDFAPSVKDLWILGGNYAAIKQSKETAEYNFLCDPEAARIVFESFKQPIHFFPAETWEMNPLSYEWLFNELETTSPAVKLYLKAERSINHKIWLPADGFLTYCFIEPDKCIAKSSFHNVEIELHDMKHRGWVMLDRLDVEKNVTMIEAVNTENFKSFILQVGQGL